MWRPPRTLGPLGIEAGEEHHATEAEVHDEADAEHQQEEHGHRGAEAGEVVEAGEEAILESLVVNDTMVGRDGVTARALPHDRLRDLVGTAPLWATPPA
ncbi:MAG: hypothetical protein VXW27_09795 [Pseudomonadota bacterium]|nr:hypothetical protein [Pseudomonadota bacterium]